MLSLRSTLKTLLLLFLLPALAQAADPAAGHWEGEIELPTGKLQVLVDLQEADGAWTGTIDIPAQGAKALPLEKITVENGKVRFTITGVPGTPTFDGTLAEGTIRGTFTQATASLPFRLGREAVEVQKPGKPQDPKPPYPYTEEEVTYTNGDVKLAGTLTVPQGDGPFPAVVLITGSGAQDRNEEIAGHKPFWVLADHLSRHGIAVLRVDDRGVGGSTGSVSSSTTADFAQDVLAGVRFLKTRPKIAAGRIGLVGHSEGGLVAPLAASQSADVAFVVMLAGPGVPGPEILIAQSELIARAEGVPEEKVKQQVDSLRRVLEVARTEKDPEVRRTKLQAIAREALAAALSEEELKTAGGLDALVDAQLQEIDSPWFRAFLSYDPRPALRKVKVPVLAVIGSLDLQVPPDQNLPEIEKALKEAGNPDVTLRRVAGMNHIFQPAKTGGLSEYAAGEVTVMPELLDLVTGWITERFAARPASPSP